MDRRYDDNLSENEILDNSPEQLNLLNSITQLLWDENMNQQLRDMDMEVAKMLEPHDFNDFQKYKLFCLNQLHKYCSNVDAVGALDSAIQQGFILGYWIASQHEKQI